MIETLQSLRIVFALTVMLAHFSYAGIEGKSTGVGPMYFMLMTGVVMSRSYGRKILDGSFSFMQFMYRRLCKFYPLHLLCLLAVIAIRYKTMSSADWLAVVPNALLIQSWIPVDTYYFSCNAVSWYLSDLMLFLLLFPMFYRLIGRMKGRSLIRLTVALLVMYIIYVSLLQTDDLNYWLYVFPPVRLIDFIWGMVIWRCYELHPTWGRFRCPILVELLICAGVLATIITYPINEKWHVAFIHWIFMVPLVLVFMQGDRYGGWISRFLKTRTMVWLGALTLDTYLLHQLLFSVILNNADKQDVHVPYLLMLAFCLSMVILLSHLTHKWVVTPIQQHLLSYMNKKNNNG